MPAMTPKLWAAILALVTAAGFTGAAVAPTTTVTKTITGCQVRGPLPDPGCTPGATNPDVTQATIGQTICVKGWTATVRPPQSVTGPIKVQVEKNYGIPGPHPHPFTGPNSEELDHLVPLELGGSPASIMNLWPEAGPGFHVKDMTENRLKAEVCNGSITLATAQHAISTDWTKAP